MGLLGLAKAATDAAQMLPDWGAVQSSSRDSGSGGSSPGTGVPGSRAGAVGWADKAVDGLAMYQSQSCRLNAGRLLHPAVEAREESI